LKVIITGAAGLVGRATASTFAAKGEQVSAFTHDELDIGDESAVREIFRAAPPEVVVNCAAWTDVDGAEKNSERAFRANALGPELLALACRESGSLLITISTDYVFDGDKDGFYTQRDQPNPQGVYARSKLEGEQRAQRAWARTIVVRSGYIFGDCGRNFLSTFIDTARAGKSLKAIKDTWGTPTYAPHLAARLHDLATIDLPGIYHVVNAGEGVTFAQFVDCALEIGGLDRSLSEPVSMDSLRRPAPRPRNSRLRCLLSEAIGLPALPPWLDAVREHVTRPAIASKSRMN
jgi:dTDP-4-dehydrorhamnose reductase